MIVDLVSSVQREDWEKARQILFQHWIAECPKLYEFNHVKPWDSPSEEQIAAINAGLFTPLVAALSMDSASTAHDLSNLSDQAGLRDLSRAGQICGHVFKPGELTYSCSVCATDPTCVMCHECFHKSEHKNHKYKIHSSNGSGYCDCGDPDAWKAGYACPDHLPREDGEGSQPAEIPAAIKTRLRALLTVVLQYCSGLVCDEELTELPHFLLSCVPEKTEPTSQTQYLTVLYNDETHTFDSVIRALEMYINCTTQEAMLIATIVDREGRSLVKYGSKLDCEKTKLDMQRKTQRDVNRRTEKTGPLEMKVIDSCLVAHQNHAVALLSWLNQQLEIFPLLAELVGEILLSEPAPQLPTGSDEMEVDTDNDTLLVRLMRWDKRLWKVVRQNVHQLLMKTVLMKYDQKLALAKIYFKYYNEIYDDFIDDDHDLEVSIVSLAVQFLTVPSIARRLIAEDNIVELVWNSIIAHTKTYYKVGQDGTQKKPFMFDFASRTFPAVLKRALHMIRDLAYVMNIPPTEEQWSDDLRENFVKGSSRLLFFLSCMQGMDEVKRQAMEHQVWEMEWESAFNIQIRIQEVLTLTQLWAYSDKTVHRRLMTMALMMLKMFPPTAEGPNGATHQCIEMNGDSTICSIFEVSEGVVSIHQPIWRFASGLFSAGNGLLDFLQKGHEEGRSRFEKEIASDINSLGSNIYEQSLRALVLCAQVTASMWRRNGFSLVNQIHNYYSPICRVEMYDRDLTMMQVAAVLCNPKDLVLHILVRYRLHKWGCKDYDGSQGRKGSKETEDLSKTTVVLAEEMLHLLINICAERYQPGVGVSTSFSSFRRELVHLLCMGPHPFSHMSDLMRKMSNDPTFEKISLHDIVNEIAEFKKPASTAAGQFHLKEEFLKEYTPFFYHYSKSNVSAAELYQQKIRSKMDRNLMACPPPLPGQFQPFFAPVVRILNCPVTIKICRIVFDRTLKRNRYSSDRQLHRALYLVGMGLQEQEMQKGEFDYLTPAAEEDILNAMETLAASSEVGTHADLLWWTIQKYKEIERLATTGSTALPADHEDVVEESAAQAKAKRAEMAAKMRAQALLKMQKMQNRFMSQVKEETPAAGDKDDEKKPSTAARFQDDEDIASLENDNSFPVCLGPSRSSIGTVTPRKLTCMLCQEEEILQPGQGKPFVCAAYVQKSLLFAKKKDTEYLSRNLRHDFVSAALPTGLDASTCSHVMHYECYQSLAENILNRDRARPRQQAAFQKMIDPELGEYLCPLCKRLSNTAMPVLPALQLMNIDGFSSARSAVTEDFDSWVDRMRMLLETPPVPTAQKPKAHSRKRSHSERSLVELAKQGDDLSQMPLDNNLSTSVPSASTMQLLIGEGGSASRSQSTADATNPEPTQNESEEFVARVSDLFAQQNKAASAAANKDNLAKISAIPLSILQVLKAFLKMTKQMISPSFEKYGEAMRVFSKFLVKTNRGDAPVRDVEEALRGYLSAIAVWQSTVHVMRSVSSILKVENKPLFGALNTRQRDCLTSLTRLSASLSYFMQHMPQHTQLMLRALLLPPPPLPVCPTSPKSPGPSSSTDNVPTSPISLGIPPDPSTAPASKIPLALFFLNIQTKLSAKGAAVNILHVDMLHLAMSLAMMIGWTWQDGKQSLKPKKERELLPDGSLDELYCIRLCLCGLLFQTVATFDDSDMAEESPVGDALDGRLSDLWAAARPEDAPLVDKRRLRQLLRESILSFLRPLALFYSNLTMVPPPEALRDPSVDEFEPLCRYMGLPSTILELHDGSAVQKLFEMWSAAIPSDPWMNVAIVRQPVAANHLIDLPEDFSDLIQMATSFRCPTVPFDEPATNVPTLCLICGTILCSQSYCCQRTVGKEVMGACRYHMLQCSGAVGIFLRIRDCLVIMMTSRQRGCVRAAPYVDEFGESDQGFRRGNPLHLNHALYHKLRQLWMTQGIAEEIVNQHEIDNRAIQFDFVHI